jgi:hypothetical protein
MKMAAIKYSIVGTISEHAQSNMAERNHPEP